MFIGSPNLSRVSPGRSRAAHSGELERKHASWRESGTFARCKPSAVREYLKNRLDRSPIAERSSAVTLPDPRSSGAPARWLGEGGATPYTIERWNRRKTLFRPGLRDGALQANVFRGGAQPGSNVPSQCISVPGTAWWCNGSTSDSGSLSQGSNPCRATELLTYAGSQLATT